MGYYPTRNCGKDSTIADNRAQLFELSDCWEARYRVEHLDRCEWVEKCSVLKEDRWGLIRGCKNVQRV
eukprot:scaffold8177_cov106-Cylindrotheca_fusiformis.AAC.5